ncbi:MAG: RagB/SusD family nutrient uptake outer membrane protein [Bacteroidales bacterium]|nr:RagB/SusD family nutrient uptake outer membrane protein [Bacteroidales bacterium]
MKAFKYSLLLLTCMCLLSSCDDIIDEMPEDKTTPESYFNTESDLEQYTNKFYTNGLHMSSLYEDRGDIMIPQYTDDAIFGKRIIPESGGGWNWSALRDINFYLAHSEQCSNTQARARYDGVARLFRAIFYYEKVANFGDVPWYDKALDSNDPDLYKPRDSRELVMQNIMADLDYAIENLPASRNTYVVNRYTALGFKSRIALFEGTWRKYHGLDDYEKYLQLCVSASDRLMNEGGYSIAKDGVEPYFELFNKERANSNEVILSRRMNTSLGIFHQANAWIFSPGQGGRGYTIRLAQAYLMKDGTYFSSQDGYQYMTLMEEFIDRDPRMAQTITCPGTYRDNQLLTPNFSVNKTGYQPRKWDGGKKYDSDFHNGNDLHIMRYPEILLNYAEAKAELGTLTQDDIDRTIKLIRDRVSMPNLSMEYANSNPDPWMEAALTGWTNVEGPNKGVILEIRRERTIELVQEGLRWFDIMRWKGGSAFLQPSLGAYFPAAGEYDTDGDGTNDVLLYTGSAPSSSCRYKFSLEADLDRDEATGRLRMHGLIPRNWDENRDYLAPIPSKERRLTNGALTQNPGWDDGLEF